MPGKIFDSNPLIKREMTTDIQNATEISLTYHPKMKNKPAYDLYRNYPMTGVSFKLAVTSPTNGFSTCDNYMPWKGIRKCVMDANGTIVAYQGDSNYSESLDNHNVMVEIPKFWYAIYFNTSNQSISFHISPTEKEGYFVSPRHITYDKTTGEQKIVDKIYVGAFASDYSGWSKEGQNAHYTLLYNDLYRIISQNGMSDNYYPYDFLTMITIELLRIVETGTFNISHLLSETSDGFLLPNNIGVTNGIVSASDCYHSNFYHSNIWSYRYMENLCLDSPAMSVNGVILARNTFGAPEFSIFDPTKSETESIITIPYPYNIVGPESVSLSSTLPGLKNWNDIQDGFCDWTILLKCFRTERAVSDAFPGYKGYFDNKYNEEFPITILNKYDYNITTANNNIGILLFGDSNSFFSHACFDYDKFMDNRPSEVASYSRLIYIPR